MLDASLSLSLLEIILLIFGAIILGITIHFFIASRRGLQAMEMEMQKSSAMEQDEWKHRYFNDIEVKDKEISVLKQRLDEFQDDSTDYSEELVELEELRKDNLQLRREAEQVKNSELHIASYESSIQELRRANEQLKQELSLAKSTATTIDNGEVEELEQLNAMLRKELAEMKKAVAHNATPAVANNKPDYLDQLQQAQRSLLEHNQKINALLGNIDVIKEKEEKEREILHDKERLASELDDLRETLQEKEQEINTIRQKEHLTKEMSSMLDNAYSEFGVLQEKIQKMEAQLTASKMVSLELDDLREEHLKAVRDRNEHKTKADSLATENHQLHSLIRELEEKYRDTSFQRQQLQKRVTYLEEINRDLQIVSDANKKLENQLRRVSELESMLNIVSAERDQLAAEKTTEE